MTASQTNDASAGPGPNLLAGGPDGREKAPDLTTPLRDAREAQQGREKAQEDGARMRDLRPDFAARLREAATGIDQTAVSARSAGERLGTLREDRDRWFRLALVMTFIAAAAAGFGIWAAVRSEYIPYIVAVDDLGEVQPVQNIRVITSWPDAAVRRELADLVRDWRAITSDEVILRQHYRRLQYFLEQNSAADRKVRAWAQAAEPLKTAASTTVEITVTSVNFAGGRTWLVEWSEARRNRATGQVEATSRWRGSFVLGQRRITDPAWLTWNPFGMVIEDIDARRLDQ